ncbi:hypothetical protein [Antarctobacter heliothermus]|uniref:Uncharacterized protein n=1 Tax=Antarctobacter heliothermus TaxID=74033 RepID=A0A239B5R4_9RHOB|nr:hypothetical protein [Antarctobacter heliothermus]SNS03255.1 hypothetical protein SAMN04488078_100290 [Antarctobacter heliothermus]
MKILSLAAALTLAASAALSDPMWFKSVSNGGNCADCGWTIAEGEITKDTPDIFRAFLAEHPWVREIVFHSPGGNLGAALELGRIIRENELSTGIGRAEGGSGPWYVMTKGGICNSACAFAFLAGGARTAYEDPDKGFAPRTGTLGMHQFFTPNGQEIPTAQTQQIMGQVLLYVLEMGINAEILSIASKTPADAMHVFSSGELAALGILTAGSTSPVQLRVAEGGLSLYWTDISESGAPIRDGRLRCSEALKGWELQVRQFDNAHASTGFDPNDPKNARVSVGQTSAPLTPDDILLLIEDGDDHLLTIRVPQDLRAFPGQTFGFHTNTLRNFQDVLSASLTLPDADTMDVLTRACGD